MPVEMKVWTCKFPADSDLNQRLREASKQANLPYYKLLAEMLDLWEKYQVENSLQSDNLNAWISKVEKFMKLITDYFHWEWDSETENWILPDEEQQNESEDQPVNDEPEQHTSEEDQPAIEPEQEEIKPKGKRKK